MTVTKPRQRDRRKPEERRAQILDEAVRLIGERGYHGFGIRELAQRCALTDAGLLHYFGSKHRLLIALLEDRDRRDAEFVTAAAGRALHDDHAPPMTLRQVHEVFHATVARNSASPELLRLFTVLQAEGLNAGHPAHAYFVTREATAFDAFTQTVAPYVTEPRSTALQLLAMMKGLEQEWLRTDQGFDIVAEWDRAVARLLPPPDEPPDT